MSRILFAYWLIVSAATLCDLVSPYGGEAGYGGGGAYGGGGGGYGGGSGLGIPPFFPWFPFVNPYIGLSYTGRYNPKYKGNYMYYNGDYDGYVPTQTAAPSAYSSGSSYGYGSG